MLSLLLFFCQHLFDLFDLFKLNFLRLFISLPKYLPIQVWAFKVGVSEDLLVKLFILIVSSGSFTFGLVELQLLNLANLVTNLLHRKLE